MKMLVISSFIRKQNKGIRASVFMAVILLLYVSFFLSVFAVIPVMASQKVELLYIGEDEENGYRYEWPGIGGFSASVALNGSAEVVVVTSDEGISTEVYKDGELYENEGVFYENGTYEYRGYSKNRESEGSFYFIVENTYFDESDDSSSLYEVVTNPELTISYENTTGLYSYELPNHSKFQISVPLGAVTSGSVSLHLGNADAVYSLTKDGDHMAIPDPLVFTEPGSYQMMLMNTQSSSASTITSTYQLDLTFSIIEKNVNQMDILNAPIDFQIVQIKKDGEELQEKGDSYYLKEDGYYQVKYQNRVQPDVSYYQEFRIDRIPPYLEFSQSIYEGVVKPPLSFAPSEKGCEIEVYRNDMLVYAEGNTISDGGVYRIQISDKAGNTRAYYVSVSYTQRLIDNKLIILSVVFLLAVGGWLFYQRKHMQIL